MSLSASVAATGGYFNIGEIMVYTAALLMGPYVGAFAGGVGSMLSDLALGFPQFAPGTLVIKGVEGYIVGRLGSLPLARLSLKQWRLISIAVGAAVALIVALVGTNYYTGEMTLSLGVPFLGQATWGLNVTPEFWYGLSALSLVLVIVAGFSVEQRVGWLALSVLVGGTEMVAGYFLYERLILGQIAAFVEVPFNVAQVSIGLLVSIPLVRSVKRMLRRKSPAPG